MTNSNPRRAPWPIVLPIAAVLLAALLGFAWTRPGHRVRHVQLRAFAGEGAAYEARLRAALDTAGVALVTGGRDLAVSGAVERRGGTLKVLSRFEDAREGRIVWRRQDLVPADDPAALDRTATLVARTVACGLRAFDTGRPPRPPATVPPLFRACEAAAISRAAAR